VLALRRFDDEQILAVVQPLYRKIDAIIRSAIDCEPIGGQRGDHIHQDAIAHVHDTRRDVDRVSRLTGLLIHPQECGHALGARKVASRGRYDRQEILERLLRGREDSCWTDTRSDE
jgi:hypothetical protein